MIEYTIHIKNDYFVFKNIDSRFYLALILKKTFITAKPAYLDQSRPTSANHRESNWEYYK